MLDSLGVSRAPSRIIRTLVRPTHEFAFDERGRLHKAGADITVRLFQAVSQTEVGTLGLVQGDRALDEKMPSGLYWAVSPISNQEDVDFHILRMAFQSRSVIGMGVAEGAPSGAGSILLVPTHAGFALHAVSRAREAGPFERLFSQCLMTIIVDDWPAHVAPERPKSEEHRGLDHPERAHRL